jgi:hypothetical protein
MAFGANSARLPFLNLLFFHTLQAQPQLAAVWQQNSNHSIALTGFQVRSSCLYSHLLAMKMF